MIYILLIIGIIILVILKTYYNHIINTYFRNKNNIMYDYLIQYIQVVDDTNYFMNYGLWDNNHTTLKDANENLCHFIYNKANLEGDDGFCILDVGCGYGHQDFYWINKLNPRSKIYAVDISDTQIKYATDMSAYKQIPESKLQFIPGDAHNIDSVISMTGLGLNKFDRIISLESAFHYKDRPLFFNHVGKLLDKNGRFIISDIILSGSGSGSNSILLNLFCDFLHIPKQNLICLPEWKSQLETAGLTIMDIYDVTEQTFCPYYKYFFTEYIKNKGLPEIMARMLYSIFTRNQPFSYIIAVCSLNGL